MFENIEFHEERLGEINWITAYKNGRALGSLEYRDSSPGSIHINRIGASQTILGMGNELLSRFAKKIDPDKTIQGEIIHEGTVNWLARNGFLNGVQPGLPRTFSNPQTLNSFPFRRFLDKAGIELISLTTSYNERDFLNGDIDFPYETVFIARIKP